MKVVGSGRKLQPLMRTPATAIGELTMIKSESVIVGAPLSKVKVKSVTVDEVKSVSVAPAPKGIRKIEPAFLKRCQGSHKRHRLVA